MPTPVTVTGLPVPTFLLLNVADAPVVSGVTVSPATTLSNVAPVKSTLASSLPSYSLLLAPGYDAAVRGSARLAAATVRCTPVAAL